MMLEEKYSSPSVKFRFPVEEYIRLETLFHNLLESVDLRYSEYVNLETPFFRLKLETSDTHICK